MYIACCYCVVAVRCLSFVVACGLLFAVRWLFLVFVLCYAVFSYSLFVVCSLVAVCCVSFGGDRCLFVFLCLSAVCFFLLFVDSCLLFAVRCLLFVVGCWLVLLVVGCSLLCVGCLFVVVCRL